MRKMTALLFVAALMLLAVMPVAAQLEDPEPPENAGFVRVAHLSPDTPNVIVFVNGEIQFSGLTFGNVTRWVGLEPGTYSIAVGTSSDIAEAALGPLDLTVETDDFVTVAALGSLDNETLNAQVFVEDYSRITTGSARLSIWHAIEGAPLVNVTASGASLADALAYPGTFVGADGSNDGITTSEVPAGTYDVSVTADNDPNAAPILEAAGFEVAANSNYLIVAAGTPDVPSLVVVETDQDEFGVAPQYGDGEARVRVAHLSPDAPAVNILVNGEVVFSGLRFNTVTRFLPLPPGTYEIIVSTNSSVSGAVIGPADLTFADGTFTTVAAIGSVEDGTLAPAVITELDANATNIVTGSDTTECSDMEAGQACVVIYHAIEDAPDVSIVAGAGEEEIELVARLGFPGTYQDVFEGGFNDGKVILTVPAGTYDLSVVPVGGTDAILEAPGVELVAGQYYFIAATGSVAGGSAGLLTEVVDPENIDPDDPF